MTTDTIAYFSKFLDAIERPANIQFGVLTRRTHNGKTYAFLDDATNFTEGQALNEAYHSDKNDLLGIFSVNMATGEIKQVMNRAELIAYCEHEDERNTSEADKAERSFLGNHNFQHDTTL